MRRVLSLVGRVLGRGAVVLLGVLSAPDAKANAPLLPLSDAEHEARRKPDDYRP